ncbi:hypothetical protein L7F22_026829 [Adiantum nelumboides]|nr:hypothetical protein [Adiantum nelumboides]
MAYQLKLPNHWLIHNAFHVSLLKPYKEEPPSEAIMEDPPEVEDQEEVLQLESILRHEDKVLRHDTVLRTHTSAHQAQKLREGCTHFLVTGDVYRRDSIDATHYPVFHQMEGFPIFSSAEWEAAGTDGTSFALQDLKDTLEGLAKRLFGDVETRWVDTYFPFTNPSLELEIFFQIVQSG